MTSCFAYVLKREKKSLTSFRQWSGLKIFFLVSNLFSFHRFALAKIRNEAIKDEQTKNLHLKIYECKIKVPRVKCAAQKFMIY